MVGAIVLIVGMCFTRIQLHHPLVTLATLLLTSVMFGFAGFINAMYAKKFDDISIVPTFILTPLTYLGGVFYSVSLLPPFWEKVSHMNPILYMVNAFRYGLLGVSDVPLGMAFAVMIGFTLALGAFSMHLLVKGRGLRA
jgi:ABC-2 type transport system permease protein